MKGLSHIAALLFAAGLVSGAAAQPAPTTPQPFEMVRSLEALQDQIVIGNEAAFKAQPSFVTSIAEKFAAAPLAVWHDPKNIRAATVYLLSGGHPQVVEGLVKRNAFPQDDLKLIKGALAIDEGRKGDAWQLLSDIDARSLPADVGGYLAFAQARLLAEQDQQKAMELLDVARLLMPGTLVEEAALRREIFLANEIGDGGKFVLLSSQYIRRFQKSLYSDNFRLRFASAVVHLDLLQTPGTAAHLDDLLQELTPDDQRNISLLIARTAVIDDKPTALRFAVDRIKLLTQDGSIDRIRAEFYDAAALIQSKDCDKGLTELKAIDRSQLPPPDAELYDAVAAIGSQIAKWSDAPQKPDSAAPSTSSDDQMSSATSAVKLAEQSLAEADQLLKE